MLVNVAVTKALQLKSIGTQQYFFNDGDVYIVMEWDSDCINILQFILLMI